MATKVFLSSLLLIVCVCNIQGCSSQGPKGALFAYQPKLQELRLEITKASTQAQTQLQTVSTSIQNNVDAAKTVMEQRQNDFNDVLNLQDQSSPCVAQAKAAVAAVNENSLDVCSQTAELNALRFQVVQLSTLQGGIGRGQGLCMQQFHFPSQGVQLTECLDTLVEDGQNQLEGIQSNVEMGVQAVEANSAACIAADNSISTIDNAEKALGKCLEKEAGKA